MSKKYVKFSFSLILAGILPLMGMDNQNTKKWLGMPLDEQETLNIIFNLSDIDIISKNDPEKGLLLDLHLKDLLSLKKITPNESIKKILENNKDNQQEKMMGLIECANFISSPFLENLIQYALTHGLVPKKLLEVPDTTVKSFYEIKNFYTAKAQKTLQVMTDLLPNFKLESNMEYPLDHTFDPVVNDIKTIKYKNDEKDLDTFNNLTAFEAIKDQNNTIHIITNSKKKEQRKYAEKTFQTLLKSTSLPNKISLILRLNELNKLVSKNIDIATNDPELRSIEDLLFKKSVSGKFNYLESSILGSLFAMIMVTSIHVDIAKETKIPNLLLGTSLLSLSATGLIRAIIYIAGIPYNKHYTSIIRCYCNFGSHFGLPIPTLYYLYQYYTQRFSLDKKINEMKEEEKNIQNLIEEFKESIKKEYSL